MKILTTLLIVFAFIFSSFGQKAYWLDTFFLQPKFHIGDSRTYEVTDKFKASALFSKTTYENKYLVNFTVQDIEDGGYWIRYTAKTIDINEKKPSSESVVAELSNGITVLFYLKENDWKPDSVSYHREKQRIALALDSLAAIRTFDKYGTYGVKKLQNDMKEEAGLERFLVPMTAFANMYLYGVYKKYMMHGEAYASDIMKKNLVQGNTERKWVGTSKDSTVKLTCLFTGDPVYSAAYFWPFYKAAFDAAGIKRTAGILHYEMHYTIDHTYKVNNGTNFPEYIFLKTVTDLVAHTVDKLTMKLVGDGMP